MTNTDVLNDSRARDLIEQGARDGRLSYNQINDALGDLLLDETGAETLLEALDARGIQIIADAKQSGAEQAAQTGAEPQSGSSQSGSSQAGTPSGAPAPRRSRYSDLDEALASLDDLLLRLEIPGESESGKTDPLFNDDESEDSGVEDAFRQYLNRMGRVPRLSTEEEIRLARQARDGSEYERDEAHRQLAEANLRLVVSLARNYKGRTTLPMLDLVQEGNIGLMRAVERFNPDKGERLGSFATWYIREAIRKALGEQARLVRLPSHLAGVLRKLQRLQRELTQDLGREPGHDELARAAGLTLAQVEEALRAADVPLSLEASRGDDDDSVELGDLIASGGEATEDQVSRTQLRSELDRALDGLSDREKAILQMRFGVGAYAGEQARAQDQIAADLKISRDRVRQLEVRALRKLRRRSRAGALGQFLESRDADE